MLSLPERLTHREAAATLAQLQVALGSQSAGAPLVIDATSMQQYDSSALVVLLGLLRHAASLGHACRLNAVPARLQQLAKVYGVLELLDLDAAPVAV